MHENNDEKMIEMANIAIEISNKYINGEYTHLELAVFMTATTNDIRNRMEQIIQEQQKDKK